MVTRLHDFFCSILGNEGHSKKRIIMITGSSFAIVKVAFLAVDEQLLLLLHLLHPVLQIYSVQYVKKRVFYIQLRSHHNGIVSDWLSVIPLPFGANSQHLWQLRWPASMCKWHLAPALSLSNYICLIFAFLSRLLSMFSCRCLVAMSKNPQKSYRVKLFKCLQSFSRDEMLGVFFFSCLFFFCP